MNKLAVIVPFFMRHELTGLCFENLRRQAHEYGLTVFTAGSEGEESRRLATSFGFNYIETSNFPVSEKNNILLRSTERGGFDGVILLGSDDFMSDELIKKYLKVDITETTMYGVSDVYFYSTKTGKISEFRSNKQTIGAGRMFTRPLLDKAVFKMWGKMYANNGLDSICWMKVKLLGGKEVVVDGFVVDVKHEYNISAHSIVEAGKEVDISRLDELGEIAKKIKAMLPSTNPKQIKVMERNEQKVKVVIKVATSGMEPGDIRWLDLHLAKRLIKSGIASIEDPTDTPVKKPAVKKEPTKEKCTDCPDKEEKCEDCEKAAHTTNLPKRGRKPAKKQ